jgi:hypothetical protein
MICLLGFRVLRRNGDCLLSTSLIVPHLRSQTWDEALTKAIPNGGRLTEKVREERREDYLRPVLNVGMFRTVKKGLAPSSAA